MKITFLGTGTSHGVPSLDCMRSGFLRCPKGVCKDSLTDSLHNRTRTSLLLEYNNHTILIDVSSDFRQQALREKIPGIDAVLITHHHADHIMGIPDIRSYTDKNALPLYGSRETIAELKTIFSYIFNPETFEGGGIPKLACNSIDTAFDLFGKTVIPIPVSHGPLPGCYGYRIGSIAYIPDIKSISEQSKVLLENLDCLILDCLRETRPHVTHIILPESIALARELQPKVCYFTHMCHDIHYKEDARYLDQWMHFAFDGLTFQVQGHLL